VPAWEKRYLTWVEREGRPASPWGSSPRPAQPPKVTWFPNAETVEAAQCLVRHTLNLVQPAEILALPDALPERLRPSLELALKACLRFMLLYPALGQDSLQAIIGLCPTVVYLLNRPGPVPPAVESCKDLTEMPEPRFLL
jgi:hypothetical protein